MSFTKRLSVPCPRCAGPLDVKLRRKDSFPFVACHNYPHCDWACQLSDLAVELSRMLAVSGTTAIPIDLSLKARADAAKAQVPPPPPPTPRPDPMPPRSRRGS